MQNIGIWKEKGRLWLCVLMLDFLLLCWKIGREWKVVGNVERESNAEKDIHSFISSLSQNIRRIRTHLEILRDWIAVIPQSWSFWIALIDKKSWNSTDFLRSSISQSACYNAALLFLRKKKTSTWVYIAFIVSPPTIIIIIIQSLIRSSDRRWCRPWIFGAKVSWLAVEPAWRGRSAKWWADREWLPGLSRWPQ